MKDTRENSLAYKQAAWLRDKLAHGKTNSVYFPNKILGITFVDGKATLFRGREEIARCFDDGTMVAHFTMPAEWIRELYQMDRNAIH